MIVQVKNPGENISYSKTSALEGCILEILHCVPKGSKAFLRILALFLRKGEVLAFRGTSPIKKHPTPEDPHKILGIDLRQGPRGVRFV